MILDLVSENCKGYDIVVLFREVLDHTMILV